MKLYFIRHGESTANVKRIFSHRGLVHGLSLKGRMQVRRVGRSLRKIPFDKVYASPNIRGRETADILKRIINMDYELCEELQEVNMGILEGYCDDACWRKYRQIFVEWLLNLNHDFKLEDSECYHDLIKRFDPFITMIKSLDPGVEHVLVIGHSGLLRCVLPYYLENISYTFAYENSINYAMIIEVLLDDNRFSCLKWGKKILKDYS